MQRDSSIIYLAYYGFEGTVIDSQVITPVTMLEEEGITVNLVFFEKFADFLLEWPFKGEKRRKLSALELSSCFLPRIPRNFLLLNSIILFFVLIPSLLSKKSIVIHARGFQGAYCAGLLKKFFSKIRLICDIRGLETEEYAFVNKSLSEPKKQSTRSWQKKLKGIEEKAMQWSDVLFCVSKSMTSYLQELYPFSKNKNWEYVPCAVDLRKFISGQSMRAEIREKLGIKDKVVLVYSGASQLWQSINLLPSLFNLLKQVCPNAFFLGLTPDPEKMAASFIKENIPLIDCKFLSVKFEEIQGYLCSSDVGVLLREENKVNAYSCPTKFAEYLASGLHVLTTTAVKDISDLLKKEPVGTALENVFDREGTLKNIVRMFAQIASRENRVHASVSVARQYYDWKNYVPVLKKWYLDLLQR